MPVVPQAQLTVVAEFPKQYFLENLAVRSDRSILVTAFNKKELWYVPSPYGALPVTPLLMHAFDLLTLCVVETDADVFLIGTSDVYGTREAKLYRLNLRSWSPGESIRPQLVLEFPEPKVGLNGGCLIAPGHSFSSLGPRTSSGAWTCPRTVAGPARASGCNTTT